MSDTAKGLFFSGTSGVVLPVPNKLGFPAEFQDKSRLCYYASLVNSVEINSSFYKIPMAKTVEKWANDVPGNFRFTFKLWKGITHNKGFVFDPDDVDRFIQTIDAAGSRKGSLLVQFPASITVANAPQLQHLLHALQHNNAGHGWDVAVEFRSKSWYNDDIYQLLQQYHAGVVLHDMPASAAPLLDQDVNFVYLRFHGPNGGYRGSYSDDFLYEYAQYIQAWRDEGKTVYTYFNNTMGEALKNLNTLNNYIYEI